MNKVIFKIDPQKEYKYHQLFLDVPEFNNLSPFTNDSISDKDQTIGKIESFWNPEKKAVTSVIKKEWREVEKEYFPLIKELTGVDWLYTSYYAYFLAFCKTEGFSNPFNLKSREIILTSGAIINPKFLVGHELFHSHYYYIVNKLGMASTLNRTLFTEGVAALVLSDPKIKGLFTETDFPSSINSYPEVKEQWIWLQDTWYQRSNFKSFLTALSQYKDSYKT